MQIKRLKQRKSLQILFCAKAKKKRKGKNQAKTFQLPSNDKSELIPEEEGKTKNEQFPLFNIIKFISLKVLTSNINIILKL